MKILRIFFLSFNLVFSFSYGVYADTLPIAGVVTGGAQGNFKGANSGNTVIQNLVTADGLSQSCLN